MKKNKRREAEGAEVAEAAEEEAAAVEEAPEPAKKRRRRGEDGAAAEETGAAAAPGAGASAGADERKRKRPKADADAGERDKQPAVSEDQRREAQRAIQQLVVKLRAEGRSQQEISIAKQELKLKFGPLRQPESRKARKAREWQEWQESEKAQAEKKDRRQREHELVVIPVFWRGRHDQQDVLQAAQDLKACIAQQGVDVWLDSRRHYTPGQKFAHWEHRGVLLRVEVGPDDLKAGVCRVCKAKTPGEYKSVERKQVRLPPEGTRALLLTLKDFGLSKLDVERRPGDSDDEAGGPPPKAGKAAAAPDAAEDDADVAGNWAPRIDPKAEKKKAKGKKKKGK